MLQLSTLPSQTYRREMANVLQHEITTFICPASASDKIRGWR